MSGLRPVRGVGTATTLTSPVTAAAIDAGVTARIPVAGIDEGQVVGVRADGAVPY